MGLIENIILGIRDRLSLPDPKISTDEYVKACNKHASLFLNLTDQAHNARVDENEVGLRKFFPNDTVSSKDNDTGAHLFNFFNGEK